MNFYAWIGSQTFGDGTPKAQFQHDVKMARRAVGSYNTRAMNDYFLGKRDDLHADVLAAASQMKRIWKEKEEIRRHKHSLRAMRKKKAKAGAARKSAAKPRRWFAYAITDGRALKVGITRSPENRLKELQTGQSVSLQVCAVREFENHLESVSFERRFHKSMKKWHIRGEWFNLNVLDAFINPSFQRNAGRLESSTKI